MRNYLKRIGALLLCAVLLIPAGGAAAADSGTPDASMEYRLNTLNRLGLVNETPDMIDAEAAVSRVEFALAVARIFGIAINENAEVPDIAFDDMADYSTEEIYAVKLLADRGLVSGTGYRTFSPDASITQEQAAKILVCALGYGFVAQEEGGYPAGYVTRASKLGITDGFAFSGNQALTWDSFVSMLYQALLADVMQPVYYSNEMRYTVVPGENLLSNIMNIDRVRAVMVTATDKTSLAGGEGVKEGYVEIGGILYLDNGEAAQYLGKLVDVYYKRSRDDSRSIIHVALTYDQESLSLKISPELQIDGYELSYYAETGNRKTVTLAADANMIYNGEILAYNPALIDTANGQGTVLLQHSGHGGPYDLVTVEQYTNVIVKSVNLEKNIVYDLRGGALDLDAFVTSEKCTIVRDGEELEVADLQKEQILTVYRTASGDRVTIDVRNDIITGTFEQLGAKKVKISGTDYEFDSALRPELEKNLSKVGMAYLTVDHKIIWLDWDGAADLQYGYLLQGAAEGNFSTVLTLRLLSERNKIEYYEVAKNVTLKYQDGTENKTSDMDVVIAALQSGGAWKKQLIRYRLDDESKITLLCLADAAVAMPLGKHDEDFYCSVPNNGIKYLYRSNNKTVSGRFSIGNDTPIFFVSPDDSDDDDLYRCGSYTSLGNGESYLFAAYNMNGGGLADAVVCWRNISDSVGASSPTMLVDYTTSCVDSEGNAIESLHGYVNGTYVEYYTAEPLIEAQIGRPLRRGDLIAFSRDSDGAVTRVRLRVDVTQKLNNNPKMGTMDEDSWGRTTYWAFSGAFYSVEDGHAIISRNIMPYLGNIFTGADLVSEVYALPLTGNIMIYDESADAITTGTVNDIVTYQEAGEDATRAYFWMTYTSITNMYIYKFSN